MRTMMDVRDGKTNKVTTEEISGMTKREVNKMVKNLTDCWGDEVLRIYEKEDESYREIAIREAQMGIVHQHKFCKDCNIDYSY